MPGLEEIANNVTRRLVRTARYAADQLCEIADAVVEDNSITTLVTPHKEVAEVARMLGELLTIRLFNEDDNIFAVAEVMIRISASGANKIQAIKAVREVTGLGLKESKNIVDSAPSNIGPFTLNLASEKLQTIRAAGVTAYIEPIVPAP